MINNSLDKIFLINGPMRSGKDYLANILANKLNGDVAILHLAQPLKHIIATSLGISTNQLDRFKNNRDKLMVQTRDGIRPLVDFRKLLQLFGTEAMKSVFGASVWVDLLLDRINLLQTRYIIVPDWRFDVEYYKLVEVFGDKIVTIQLISKATDRDKHKSELGVSIACDYVFDNTAKDHDKLVEFVDSIIASMN